MYKNKKLFALIPARGGSKGLPNKNLKEIGGRSLVEWALFTAKQCDFIDHIIVSFSRIISGESKSPSALPCPKLPLSPYPHAKTLDLVETHIV